MTPQDLLSRLLYRDGLMLIIDKPAGLPVHGGPGGGDNLERHFSALQFGLPHAPTLAHRLDRETSGCLILGRHRQALRRLGRLFTKGTVNKTYWAVVQGVPAKKKGRIDLALTKKTPKRGWHMCVDPEGKAAITDYKVMGTDGTQTWLELYPRTGRTHQIRVHCAAIGHPLVGESFYGPEETRASRETPMLLHARRVVVPLYPKKDAIEAEAPVPTHMLKPLKACGFNGD